MPLKKKINNLIEMQQAEIERLRLTNESLNEIIGDLLDDWSSAIEKAKSEAIKEFAELVKMEFYKEFDELIPSIMADRIDNLVKEMTEEEAEQSLVTDKNVGSKKEEGAE